MKRIVLVTAIAFGLGSIFSSCSKKEGCTDVTATNYDADAEEDDGSCIEAPADDNVLSGSITSNTTLTADKIWFLDGRVIVESGAELTIEAGTIIKGYAGVAASASSLVIARGAKIYANGTASNPIIFTTNADNIAIGEIASPNLDPQASRGFWGGIIILGAAPISPEAGTTEQIEGIPASVTSGNYGGTDANDNSGVLQYVSIRHGGTEIGAGNEINGLTLGGVGAGTTIDHIEVIGNVDDGIEFFGGTVNASDLIVWYQGDDAYDIDQAYSGTISNIAYLAGADSDHAFEIDGPEGSATGSFTIQNGKLQGDAGEYADWRDGAMGTLKDCYFWGFDAEADVELDNDGVSANYDNDLITMTGLVFNAPAGVTIEDIAADKADNPSGDFDADFAANNSIGTTPSAGNAFDKSAFTGWTWADVDGKLADF